MLLIPIIISREGHGATVRAWRHVPLPMSLPPCGFESSLVQDVQRNIMFPPSQSRDVVKILSPWARNFTLICFT